MNSTDENIQNTKIKIQKLIYSMSYLNKYSKLQSMMKDIVNQFKHNSLIIQVIYCF